MKINDIISNINPVTMTADDLWAVYTIVKMNNGGVVPMDEVDTKKYNYGVKAEKAKARKSRKACREEGRHHANKGWNVDCNRLYNLECKRIAVKKAEKHFKADMALKLAEAEIEVAEARAEARAEADTEEEVKPRSMEEMIEDMVKII